MEQVIDAIYPNDYEVIKKIDDKGIETFYHQSTGNEIRTCTEGLDVTFQCLIEPLKIIEHAISAAGNQAIANLLTVVRQNIENTIYEIFHFLEKDIGTIDVTRIYELNDTCYRWGRCVDVQLSPPDASGDYCPEYPAYEEPSILFKLFKELPSDKMQAIETTMRAMIEVEKRKTAKVN